MAASSILAPNPVLSVLCLVFVFVLGSTFIVSIGLDYLGILLLLIYVGAISVLFLFVIMMLNVRQTELNQSFVRFWWLGTLVSFFFFFELMFCVFNIWDNDINFISNTSDFSWLILADETNNIEIIGEFLFLYNWDFLLIAILLLLVAVLGPVYISQLNYPKITQATQKNAWNQLVRSKIEILQKNKDVFYKNKF